MINEIVTKKDNIQFVMFDEAFRLVQDEIDRALTNAPLIIRKYTEHLKLSRGKFIRTIALLSCAENKDAFIHPNAVKFAAAIEILHLATLVHDDVIDNAELRRGAPTLQKKFGKKTAVICGDYLLCTALKMASSISDKEEYLELSIPDYMGRVCLGELNQHINNDNLDLSAYEYFKIISGKTAALFEASFYAGALTAKGRKADLNRYKRLGWMMGMIFQLADDCIDFEKDEETAKKPVQSDYEQGVITLPLIHALGKLREFKEKAKDGGISRIELNDAVQKTGGLIFTRMISKRYYNKSLRLIEELDAPERKKNRLRAILDKASGLVKP